MGGSAVCLVCGRSCEGEASVVLEVAGTSGGVDVMLVGKEGAGVLGTGVDCEVLDGGGGGCVGVEAGGFVG